MILNSKISLKYLRRVWRFGHCESSSICVTLSLLLCIQGLFSTKHVARCCTISSFLMSVWLCGSQIGTLYSSIDSTSCLYACTLRCTGQVFKFLCRKPILFYWLYCKFWRHGSAMRVFRQSKLQGIYVHLHTSKEYHTFYTGKYSCCEHLIFAKCCICLH